MRCMLDTNVCVDLIQTRNDRFLRRMKRHGADELCVSSAMGESGPPRVFHGVEKRFPRHGKRADGHSTETTQAPSHLTPSRKAAKKGRLHWNAPCPNPCHPFNP